LIVHVIEKAAQVRHDTVNQQALEPVSYRVYYPSHAATLKQAGQQRDKGYTQKNHAAPRHKLFHALRFRGGVIRSVPFQKIYHAPHGQTCAERDDERLQSIYCATEKSHKITSLNFDFEIKKAAKRRLTSGQVGPKL